MPVVSPARRVHVERVMGTVASLDIRAGRADGLDAAIASLHDADARFSTYRPDSEISRIARGLPVGGELEHVDAGTLAQALLERRPA